MSLALDSWSLGVESCAVVGLRLAKLGTLDVAAGAEAQLMVAEKLHAIAELQMMAMTGTLGTTAHGAARKSVAHYRKAVARNRRRLSQ
jgi:hypothetical protein